MNSGLTNAKKSRLLLVGPRHAPEASGGVTVLFELLCSDVAECEHENTILDTNSRNYSSRLSMVYAVLKGMIQNRDADILIFNATQNDVLFLGPFVALWKLVFGKTIALRKFAGSFSNSYASLPLTIRLLVRWTLKSFDLLFFETKEQVCYFKNLNKRTHLFPNVRKPSDKRSPPYNGGSFNILFASTVCDEKGVNDLLCATQGVDLFRLTVAGPVKDKKILQSIESQTNASYAGALNSSEVIEKMTQSHALALPTFYDGEGYPGVIIEAFSVGLPVVSTNWRSIPEMVGPNALLVNPRNVTQLREALTTVLKNHKEFKERSSQGFSSFDSLPATRRVLKICEGSLNKNNG